MKFRLSNALSKIIKQEKKGELHQITGSLHDGATGFCLSGAFAQFFGVEKSSLKGRGQVRDDWDGGTFGKNYQLTYGDIKFSGKCPLYGAELPYDYKCDDMLESIELLMIHLNDRHHLSFTQAQQVIEELEL